jgi:hypothetical protein
MEPESDPPCEHCGAPRNPGLVACSYCEVAFAGAPEGVNCPACGDDNRPHLVACASCKASLMRGCIFCGSASSLAFAQCHRCGEAFEGAEERKAQRDEQQRQQQMIGLATTGISMLGQVASSPTGQGLLGQVWNEIVSSANKKS